MRARYALLFGVIAATTACKKGGGGGEPGESSAGSGGGSAAGSAAPAAAKAGSAGSAAVASAPAAPAAAPGKPLRQQLVEAAKGYPVLLAIDDQGRLVARMIDNSFSQVIAPGPYGDAAIDASLDLVWLRKDDRLEVLDLRTADPPQLAISFPAKALEQLGQHLAQPPKWTMDTGVTFQVGSGCSGGAGIKLDWAAGGGSPDHPGFRADHAWFAAHDKREQNPALDPYAKSNQYKIPRDVGTCAADVKKNEIAKSECGIAYPFGALGPELVVVTANPDAPSCQQEQRCQLYDPATKKYAPVPGFDEDDLDAPTCGPFLFSPDERAYLMKNKVCDVKCVAVGKLAIGWIKGNRVLSLAP